MLTFGRLLHLEGLDDNERQRKLPETMSHINIPKPIRTVWEKAPRVQIIARESAVKNHERYGAAKAGDNEAAVELVTDIVTEDAIKRIRRDIRGRDPLLIPVHALETESVNTIPMALAIYLADKLDLVVNTDVLQANRVSHTSASGYHRLATPAIFEGEVIEGAEYYLVDDFVGQGGTLANLRGFIEHAGGIVIGATTLTGQRRSAILAPSQETLEKLGVKHGDLEEWWQKVFGYGFDFLTESEARYLFRSSDADRIREGIIAAARAGNQRDDAGDD
tara:strand:- start:398 stop:1228 length:831 start_codon:yes stop_codon:yes gene_type:complete